MFALEYEVRCLVIDQNMALSAAALHLTTIGRLRHFVEGQLKC